MGELDYLDTFLPDDEPLTKVERIRRMAKKGKGRMKSLEERAAISRGLKRRGIEKHKQQVEEDK